MCFFASRKVTVFEKEETSVKNKGLRVFLSAIMSMAIATNTMAGTWNFDGSVWTNVKADGSRVTGWYSEGDDDWYLMDDDGRMLIGWQGKYHLHEVSDGTLGRMDYGWYHDGTDWFFLNTEHDGTFGAYLSGWQWIDGYCYYFDETGKMLHSCTTPDGYDVNADGRWVENGIVKYTARKGLVSKHQHASQTADNTDNVIHQDNNKDQNSGSEEKPSGSKDDHDSDKVSNSLEAFLGTDPSKDDSDGDGLSDYIEITDSLTDPAQYDTGSEGMSDGEKDSDSDGLTNLEEVKYGTSCSERDTDFDGLSDYDEVHVYHTDPLNPDSDSDGIWDGKETEYGLDPLKAKTDGETEDGKVKRTVSFALPDSLAEDNAAVPTVSASVTWAEEQQFSISESDEESLKNSTFGLGKPVTIKTDVPVTLSFAVRNSEGLVVLKMNDEKTEFIIPEVSGNELSVSADSGTYMVVNAENFLDYIGVNAEDQLESPVSPVRSMFAAVPDSPNDRVMTQEEIEYESGITNEELLDMVDDGYIYTATPANASAATATPANAPKEYALLAGKERATGISDYYADSRIIFVIDDTGSMGSVIQNVKKNIIEFNNLLQNSGDVKASYGLVTFRDIAEDGKDSTQLHMFDDRNFTTSTRKFAEELNRIIVNGGGDTDETPIDALYSASQIFRGFTGQKYIVLVTDAGYKDLYSGDYHGMADAVKKLKESGIITSVVSHPQYEYTYGELYRKTGGIFANIADSTFSEELAKLAGMISETSEGVWVMLDNFTKVRLDGPVDDVSALDTDHDGLTDRDELGELRKVDLNEVIEFVLKLRGIGIDMNIKELEFWVYDYRSNPVLPDTDYDGIRDGEDANPKSNSFAATWYNLGEKCITDTAYTVNLKSFFNDPTTYNSDLATLSLLMSAMAYSEDENKGSRMGVSDGTSFTDSGDFLHRIGFAGDGSSGEPLDYRLSSEYHDSHLSEAYIGYQTIQTENSKKNVVAIIIRGTNGSPEEWSSNFNIGYEAMGKAAHTDWNNTSNHMGFDIAANRIKKQVDSFVEDNEIEEPTYWITGHSRGAGIANILAAEYAENNEVFAYTFAAPATTVSMNRNDAKYRSIFNVINKDDFVPMLPCAEWNFGLYGVTKPASAGDYAYSIASSTVQEKDKLLGLVKEYEPLQYKANRQGVEDLERSLSTIAADRDETYTYFCDCHKALNFGDVDPGKIRNDNCVYSLSAPNYPNVCDGFYTYEQEGSWLLGYCKICQTGQFYMQLLGNVMAGGNAVFDYATVDVADRFEGFKLPIAWQYMVKKAFNHPHYCESYYALTKYIN